jgi:proteasome accessory factor A
LTSKSITPALFGSEVEYGVSIVGKSVEELIDQSKAVVDSYKGVFASAWNYGAEDPRADMRGYRVDRLKIDPSDAKLDSNRTVRLPVDKERADHVLTNGARLYNDHGHPEYSTPECRALLDLVAHEKAGERIVLRCARERAAQTGDAVSIYKNNTDFHGNSYGAHESYLMLRERPFADLASVLLPFFVTRIVYCGAGKVGAEPGAAPARYQISQRADYFTENISVDTLYHRPILNTRDEAHADPRLWRRLHVICGDANLSEFAIALRTGATSLVTKLIDIGWRAGLLELENPVGTIRSISRDETFRWDVKLSTGKIISALDIQRVYLTGAKEELKGTSDDADWAIDAWERTLDSLETDPMLLFDRLDWVAKKRLIDDYLSEESLPWDNDMLQAIDLAYCNIDPDESLFQALADSGEMMRLADDNRVSAAMDSAPSDTRASVRGEIIRQFSESVVSVSWGKIEYIDKNGEHIKIDLSRAVEPESLSAFPLREALPPVDGEPLVDPIL